VAPKTGGRWSIGSKSRDDDASSADDLNRDSNPCLSRDHVFANTFQQLRSSQLPTDPRD